ncbi:hypothetical protein GF336_00630 [Candidatus Woesearchaeota archaeon]|nr:hypothetical protein [Candidatus Woesearchaeota archaeon]
MALLNLPDTQEPMDQVIACLKYFNELDLELKKYNKVVFDLSKIRWILPCSSLLLSHKIENIRLQKKNFSIVLPESKAVTNHLKQIGFPLGSKRKEDRCSPIIHFMHHVNESVNELFDLIDHNFPDSEEYNNAIKYILSELVTNIEEHSGYKHATITAQYYKTKKMIDIGVIDDGISIPGRFRKKGIKFNEDYTAINNAIEGTSTKNERGRGRGLSSINKLNKGLKGELNIVSRGGALVIKNDGKHNLYILENNSIKGTLVYLKFHKPAKKIEVVKYI